MVDFWSHDLDQNQMYPNCDTFEQLLYPAWDTLQHVIKTWCKEP